jgi:hypothetical protein
LTPPRMISERAERLLRKEGVPEEMIERFRGNVRVWIAPLRGVVVDGERIPMEDENREVVAQAILGHEDDLRLRHKVAEAGGRFQRAV